MSKLDHLRQKNLNPADELRSLLNALEDIQPKLNSLNSIQTLQVLQDLDQVYKLMNHLEETGANLASEQGRFGAIQSHLKSRASTLLRGLGGVSALSKHRPEPEPDRAQWWWYIHEIVAVQRQRLFKRAMLGVIVVLLIFAGIGILFNTILAPSPEAVARVEAENDAMSAYENGNYQEGLDAVEKGLAIVPDDPALLLIKGVLLENLGQAEAAAQSFEQARQNVSKPIDFYIGRGQLYIRTNQPIKTEEDARAALAIDDKAALPWLLLGQALESQGQRFESISAYEQASELALENGDNEIVVLARLALGRIATTP
jgi:tetratricopeptide (TPR) repeat protein